MDAFSTVGAAGQSAGKHMSLDTLFVYVCMRVYPREFLSAHQYGPKSRFGILSFLIFQNCLACLSLCVSHIVERMPDLKKKIFEHIRLCNWEKK